MARKKQQTSDGVDTVFQAVHAAVKAKFGDKVYVGGDEETRIFCLDVPFLLKVLFQMPGMPMGRLIMVVGPPESCKSAFTYELGRIHGKAGGGHSLIETENKDSSVLHRSIAGYGSHYNNVYVENIEEWQGCVSLFTEQVIEALDARKPPRSCPWLIVVDSLGGNTTKGISDKIEEEGAAKLVQPQAANLINTFLKHMVHRPGLYPITYAVVNHLKLAKDSYGNLSVRQMQGGYAPRFHESIEIEMSPVGKQQERREPRHERFKTIEMRVAKNSLAQRSPPIKVEMVWYFTNLDPTNPDSPVVQRTFWDWPTATIEYLTETSFEAAAKAGVRKTVDLHKVKYNGLNCVWSNALGIPKDAPVSLRKAGQMLDARRDLQEALFPYLGIRNAFMFEPGTDLALQRAAALEKILQMPGDLGGYIPLPDDPQLAEPAVEFPAEEEEMVEE
jgi:hypothetical protein